MATLRAANATTPAPAPASPRAASAMPTTTTAPISPRAAASRKPLSNAIATAAEPQTVKKGNRLAQFLIFSALSCVAYQLVTSGDGQLRMKTSSGDAAAHHHHHHSSNSNNSGSSSQFGSSEATCILACLGLFGLIRHKTKESAAKTSCCRDGDESERERELLLTERRVLKQRRQQQQQQPVAIPHSSSPMPTDSPPATGFSSLPLEVLHDVLLLLSPRELSQCPIVCKQWLALTGDAADAFWRLVFARDFGESGERFRAVFPIESWRQFYFQHHESRAVELARLLGLGAASASDRRLCVAIERQVYDVTSFIHSHPGGYHVIGDVVGTDATAIWDQFQHSAEAKESMKEFVVFDAVLSAPPLLRGNLATVRVRWQRLSWCLTHAHSLGPMATPFTDVMFKLHARSIRKSRAAAQLAA